MSSLAQQLIGDLTAEYDARLTAIEAASGRIEEVETLASTLRHFGINASAHGFTQSHAGVHIWAQAFPESAAAFHQALAEADLRIETIEAIESDANHCNVRLHGLDVDLSVAAGIAAELRTLLGVAHA